MNRVDKLVNLTAAACQVIGSLGIMIDEAPENSDLRKELTRMHTQLCVAAEHPEWIKETRPFAAKCTYEICADCDKSECTN